jgi:hypothetical protein
LADITRKKEEEKKGKGRRRKRTNPIKSKLMS